MRMLDATGVSRTCPKIDSSIKSINNVMNLIEEEFELDKNDRSYIKGELDDAINLLEDIRNDNERLRDFGLDMDDKNDDLLSHINYLEKKIDILKADLNGSNGL